MNSKIRKTILTIVTIIMVGCTNNDHDYTSLNMFRPNININISDVIDMGGVRVNGIDIDMYEFKREDTIITISFNVDSNSTFICYEWLVPIPDSIPNSFFLNEISNRYNVTFNPDRGLAYSVNSRLLFLYAIENIEEDYLLGRYFILRYYPWLMLYYI